MHNNINSIFVLKFGGTSVATPERMNVIADICTQLPRSFVVLSALSGTTDALLKIGAAAAQGNSVVVNREIDELKNRHITFAYNLINSKILLIETIRQLEQQFAHTVSLCTGEITKQKQTELSGMGEFFSTILFHALLLQRNENADWLNSPDYIFLNEENEPDMERISRKFDHYIQNSSAKLTVLQGFVCRNIAGEVTTFSRGGSDYTATLVGAAVQAAEIQIWTDIDGMQTADPRIVSNTRPIRVLHYAEAAELAYFGAKILHPSTVHPAAVVGIPVRLKNTLCPEAPGTLIGNFPNQGAAVAIAAKKQITAVKIRSHRMLNAYGYLAKIFEVFAKHRTSIDIITTSEVAVSITIDDTSNLPAIIDELSHLGKVEVEENLAVISVVGNFPANRPGDAASVFNAVKEIPVRMISYGGSENNISLLICQEFTEQAMNALHENLFVKNQSHVTSESNQ